GHQVKVFDNLSQQVHQTGLPEYLSPEIEFVEGDIRDLESLREAVHGVDIIYHFAASVGVGQSMYEIADYTAVNMQGTANLLQAILDARTQLEKLVVASSMSIYGEGQYLCPTCGLVAPTARTLAQLKQKRWEVQCPNCAQVLTPI